MCLLKKSQKKYNRVLRCFVLQQFIVFKEFSQISINFEKEMRICLIIRCILIHLINESKLLLAWFGLRMAELVNDGSSEYMPFNQLDLVDQLKDR